MVTVFYFIVFIFALVLTGSFLVRNKNVDSVFIVVQLSRQKSKTFIMN